MKKAKATHQSKGAFPLVAAIALVVVAAGVYLATRSEAPTSGATEEPVRATAQTAAAEKTPQPVVPTTKEITLDPTQLASLNKAVREATKRDYTFKPSGDALSAEGVGISTTRPKVVYTSAEFERAKVTQELTELKLMKDGKVVASYKAQKSQATVEKKEKHSEILYRGVFPNVDVKYTYDGNLVEEFVIFGAAFKADLKASGADNVEVVSRFPEIKKDTLNTVGLSLEGDASGIAVGRLTTRRALSVTYATVPMATLPPSNAFVEGQQDDKALHYIAAKTLDIQEHGTDVSVALPANYIAEAAGTVYLDPSIINDNASQHGWTQGRRVVRDSAGMYHVVWMRSALYADNGLSKWRMVYAYGDGANWTFHGTIALPYHGEAQNWGHDHQYYGSIAIDSNDNIFVTWMEHHYREDPAVDTWQVYTARGFKENWTPLGRLAPQDDVHQYPGAVAVDSNDRAHLFFGQSNTTWRWASMTAADAAWSLPQGGPTTFPTSFHYAEGSVAIDSNNNIYFVAAAAWEPYMYKCNYGTATCTPVNVNGWDAPDNASVTRPVPDVNISHDTRCHQVSAAIDSNNHLHVTWRMQGYRQWGDPEWGSWRVAYARHDGNAWVVGSGLVFEDNGYNQDNPEIALDNGNNAHVLFTEFAFGSSPQKLRYWKRTAAGVWQGQGALAPFGGLQHYANLRWSMFPATNRSIASGAIDGVFVNDSSELVFFTTGQPLELVDLRFPANHKYANDTTPTFVWDRIAVDNGSNTTYTLELASSPLFGGDVIYTKTNISDNTYTIGSTGGDPTLADGAFYYWRVKATNGLGEGPVGDYYELGIDVTGPTAFQLTAPGDGASLNTRTPLFQWLPSFDN